VIKFTEIYQFLIKSSDHSLKIGALSNFAGSAWTAVLSLLFVPIYLHYLGVESYGLIGVFNSLQAFAWLFDFGLSAVINRELARLAAQPGKTQEMRDLSRTIEWLNWLMAILIAGFFLALSPLIARYWLQSESLSTITVSQSLMIMSLGFTAQWSLNLYTNGLIGLQRLPLLNGINIVCFTLRSVGSVVVLAFVSATIQAFLIWQAIVSSIQTILTALTFRRSLPAASSPARFRWRLLRERRHFAAGLTGLSVLGLILHQLDKVILSKMLSLEFFGYYTLATTITGFGLGIIPKGIASAVYPRFSYLVARGEQRQLSDLYHRSTQATSALLLPAVSILAVFPFEILKLWTRSETTAQNTWALLMVLAIGSAIFGLINIPYYMQLAHGWTKIVFWAAITSITVVTPVMIVTVPIYGAIAGAVCWTFINLLHLLIYIEAMHRYTLKGEQWKWYFVDVAKPFAVAFIAAVLCREVLGTDFTQIGLLLILIVSTAFTYVCTMLSTDFVRDWIRQFYKNRIGYASQS
jgi:O-antigen/teichoic acid export membrane protein